MRDVSFCITSCGRLDLLEKTLNSFFKYNSYPIYNFYMSDDSGDEKIFKELESSYDKIFNIQYNNRIGQLNCIDNLYKEVDTEYIFHCEDDWEFFCGDNFINDSKEFLEWNKNILQVWIRDEKDHTHPVYYEDIGFPLRDIPYKILKKYHNEWWCGFTFNPGLRRLSDYNKIKSYSQYKNEHIISKLYGDMGYTVVSISIPGLSYCKHIGDNRHISDKFQGT